jgi:SAM-dependent methyltransferase
VHASGPVLELGCGTGQLIVPIAQRGVDVTGLDLSPAMLEHARAGAERAGVEVEWVEGDMRDFDLARQFDLVFVGSNSLSHLHDLESQRKFFAAVRRHLTPRGRLVFDVANPDLRTLALFALLEDEGRKHDPIHHSQWGELVVEERGTYDAGTQITRFSWHFRSPNQRSAQTLTLHLRNFFPCELQLLVEHCGFSLSERLGDFNGAPFVAESLHQICMCQPVPAAGP